MPKPTETDVLTLPEAARFVRVSAKTLGELARSGKVPSQKVGREWRFLRTALEAWLAQGRTADLVAEPEAQYSSSPPASISIPPVPVSVRAGFGDTAFTKNRTEPLHRWVPWIAGFSASFVGEVLAKAGDRPPEEITVLDPFAGVGTTLVEAMKRGHNTIGFEINPFAALVCQAKVACLEYDLAELGAAIEDLRRFLSEHDRAGCHAQVPTWACERREGEAPAEPRRCPQSGSAGASPSRKSLSVAPPETDTAPHSRPPREFSSRVPFFSPPVERKVLRVLDFIAEQRAAWVRDLVRVALGAVMVSFSNYSYEPSLGRRSSAGKQDIPDADVGGILAAKLTEIAEDIAQAQAEARSLRVKPRAEVFSESFLTGSARVRRHSVDFLITSPPYLNNYHYVRNTRPHLFWLGLVESRARLVELERASFGKFWQTVRAGPPIELEAGPPELAALLDRLRACNPDRGVYGGSGWANYAAAYFNDCLTFCRAARRLMKPGGIAVVVIGNNILQGIEFKTDEYFGKIAEGCGFELIELHRVRKKRTGSSIVKSSVRTGSPAGPVELYETAIELKAVGEARRG